MTYQSSPLDGWLRLRKQLLAKCAAKSAILGLLLLCNSGAHAQYYDLYCRQSGASSSNASCYPARESAWVYSGGTYNWQVSANDEPSLAAVKASIEGQINSKFPGYYCSGPVASFEGDWISVANNGGLWLDQIAMRITVGTLSGGVCTPASGTNGNDGQRAKTYSCEPGTQGPYLGPNNSRFCARWCEVCARTPHPILISGGVKYFGRIFDAPSFQNFQLYRSYSSLPSYSGSGLLNPTRSDANTSNWRFMGDTTGWQLSYDARVVPTSNEAGTSAVYTVDIPGDVPNSFLLTSNGLLQARQSNPSSLVRLSDGRFLYRRSDATLWLFGTDMRLAAVWKSSGPLVTMQYTGGTLTGAVDSFGRQVQFSYGGLGLVGSIADVSGNAYGFQFDSNARLTGVGFPSGSGSAVQRQYLYENANYPGAITGEIDENGVRISSYTYDSSGRATDSVMYTTGGAAVEHYGIDHTSSSGPKVTDPVGIVRTFNFSTGGGQSVLSGLDQPAASGSAAASRSVIADSNGNPLAVNDFNGNRTCDFYDGSTSLEKVRVEGLGQYDSCGGLDTVGATLPTGIRKVSTTWHPDWRLETKVAEPGRLTTSVYNGQPDPFNANAVASCAPSTALLPDGKPIAVLCKRVEQATTDVDGHLGFTAALQSGVANRVQSWTYNAYGQVLTATDPLNHTTSYAYYADTSFTGTDPNAVGHTIGDLQTLTNAAGQVTTYTQYDKHGQLLQSSDPNGVVTANTYDLRQRLLSTSIGGQTTNYSYDPAGQLLQVTAPDASWIGYEYDPAHRLTATKDNLGNRIEYTLDNAGNRIAQNVKDPSGNLARTLARSIDALGRVQQIMGRE